MKMPEPSSTISSRADKLAGSGKVADAFAMLTAAMADGDADSAALLAQWRLSGALIRRDLGLARELFGKAATLGRTDLAPIHTALLANGAGGHARHWKDALAQLPTIPGGRAQLALIQAMALDGHGDPLRVIAPRTLSESPWVATIPAFLTQPECDFLVELANPMLQPSVVVHPATGMLIQDPVRTSSVAAFPFVLENPAVHAINRRIAAVTATAYAQGEPLQVLRYVPGQQYKMHSDALPGERNQRAVTLLVYLNDEYVGGETQFPDAAVTFRGQVGDALIFRNTRANGLPDPQSRHAGLPVQSGVKFLLSKWIRAAPLDVSGPPGRPF